MPEIETDLHRTAAALVAPGRGILAADESVATMSSRLRSAGVELGETARRDYRELLVRTPGLSAWVTGVILCDETFGQETADGTPFPQALAGAGLMPGIKVDRGTTPLPLAGGGLVTQGLDGLGERLAEYRRRGARFAKWRSVIGPDGLGAHVLAANVHALARYAAHCQEAGIVPVVEPEFLTAGDEGAGPASGRSAAGRSGGIALCQAVTANTLRALFGQLDLMGVDLAGIVLKPNLVVGRGSDGPAGPEEVARRTLSVLAETVPPEVPGIAFLSGGRPAERACADLRALNQAARGREDTPWRLTFSFGRALVDDALRTWGGQPGNVEAAQQALAANCRRASAATGARDVPERVAAGA